MTSQLNRDIITWARQGGLPVRERLQQEEAAAAAAAEKKGAKAKAPAKKANAKGEKRSQSAAPENTYTVSSAAGGQGGGWARLRPGVDLSKFREKVDELLFLGGSLDFSERPFYRTALWQATWKNSEDVIKLLFSKGASISVADYQGRTPLHEAAYYGHMRLVEFFLDHGHPIDSVDICGHTPLFRAVDGGREDVVRRLIARRAQADLVDKDSLTVQNIASFRGNHALAQWLSRQGSVKNLFKLDGYRSTYLDAGGGTASFTQGASFARDTGLKKSASTPLMTGATLMFGTKKG
eukprot:TRINITY_DN68531_c0_g1_i1.p1 TRINITY_DN68531_c0_g1~~TRINITY_DN68531_c0_g1_i1.p1  ORF type:complete len:334 (-),score=64.59 TRINITY_DN68531_c0_g1_i1:53-934(-)